MDKRKGILLGSDFDLAINPVRDASGMIVSGIMVGESIDQDAVVILKLRQGDLKEDPLLGPGLTKYMRGKYDQAAIDDRIRRHFTRAGIDYDDYKVRLNYKINNNESN